MRKFLCSLILIIFAAGLHAQENTLTMDADFLTRGEIRSGGLTAGDDMVPDFAAFILERTLLGIQYDRAGLSTRVNIQHSGTWGGAGGGGINLHEAWVRLQSQNGFFGQVGRQNLSYDDQRIFGVDDWAMTAKSHDALRLGYEGHGHKLHLIGSWNQNPVNINGGTFFSGGTQPYKALEALWYHYDIPKTHLGFSVLFMNVGMQGGNENNPEKTWQQQLLGTYISFKPEKWSAEAAYYHQLGREEHGLPVNAWMASFKGAYTDTNGGVYLGYEWLSGDPQFSVPAQGQIGMQQHKVIRGFSSLYGSHHKFYGAMDFFYLTTYYGGFTPGLQNAYVGGKWMPGKRFTIEGSYHFLATATKLRNAKMPLGHELEMSASCKIYKDARISLGYTFMYGTETMELLKRTAGKRQLHWAWISFSVSPRIFTAQWPKKTEPAPAL